MRTLKAPLWPILLLAVPVGCSEPEGLGTDEALVIVDPNLVQDASFESGEPMEQYRPTNIPRKGWEGICPDGITFVPREGVVSMRLNGLGPRSITANTFPQDTVDRIEVALGSPTGGSAVLRLKMVDADGVHELEPVTCQLAKLPEPVVLSTGGFSGAVALILEIESESKAIDVAWVEQMARVEVAEEGRIVRVGPPDSRRSGLELGPGSRVAKQVSMPSDAVLSFSLRAAVSGSSVTIYSSGERLEAVEAPTTHWKPVSIAMPSGSDTHVAIEVPAGSNGSCWVAEARIDRPSSQAPTVLLITSDTHRGDHMGRFGSGGLVRTPVLDALGDRGVFFTNCYASSNVTNPSHIALMTGTHVRDTRIANNATALAAHATTIAEAFREAGYRTFGVTSVLHLTGRQSGLDQGFDRFDAPESGKRDGRESIGILREWLEESQGQPVFAWLHVYDAHAPYLPPEKFAAPYMPEDQSDGLGLPDEAIPTWIRAEKIQSARVVDALYRGGVDYVDASLSDIFELPQMESAIVAFTSDHGETLGGTDGVYWDHRRLNVDTMHVPLVLSWPGANVATVDTPIRQLDIGRTLLALSSIDAEFPGRDLRWALDPDASSEPRFGISSHGFSAVIEADGWLLTLQLSAYKNPLVTKTWTFGQVELFDLTNDPRATVDVLEDNFEHAKKLRARLIEWLDEADPSGLGTDATISKAARDSLVSLGYSGSGGAKKSAWWPKGRATPWVKRFTD